MKQSTKDFLWFAVAPVVGLFGVGYILDRVNPSGRSKRSPAGWDVVMCSPYDGHNVCVVRSQYEPFHYSFTVDDGPTMPDDWKHGSPEGARYAAEKFIDNMT